MPVRPLESSDQKIVLSVIRKWWNWWNCYVYNFNRGDSFLVHIARRIFQLPCKLIGLLMVIDGAFTLPHIWWRTRWIFMVWFTMYEGSNWCMRLLFVKISIPEMLLTKTGLLCPENTRHKKVKYILENNKKIWDLKSKPTKFSFGPSSVTCWVFCF